MSLKMHTYPGNARAFKALIAAQYNDVKIEVPAFNMGVDNKTPAFLALNPNGKVPTLETPEGGIWESNSIARYVARLGKNALYGSSAYQAAQVDQWIDWSSNEIDLPRAAWVYPIRGYIPNNPAATAQAKTDIRAALLLLNNHLATRTFLVGERVSLADIVVSMTLVDLYTTVLEPSFRKQFQNTNRWFNTLVHQPQFAAVLGEVKLCEKMQVAPAPAAGEATADAASATAAAAAQGKGGKKGGAGGGKAPKKEKDAAPAPAPTATAAAAATAQPDDDEDDVPKEVKPKSKCDLLPPSKLVMDEWKRTYSNEKDSRKACQWLWANYDPEGYSLWFCDFKFQDENKTLFKTCNAVSGYFDRSERVRKYGFGTMLILGTNDQQYIKGAWLFRGQEIPDVMQEVDDTTLYSWKKADLAADRAALEDIFCWDGPTVTSVGPVLDGKTFK